MAPRCLLAVIAVVVASVAGCGGDGDDASKYEGAATAAVATLFDQEAAGGLLPEGIGRTLQPGITKENIYPLAVSSEQEDMDIKARFCIEYPYQRPPTPDKVRVYLAELAAGAWAVKVVTPDGTCEGVT